ncbi:hypothetical protein [Ruegeria sp.]|uniref:hypothetical protein n=1 Tax=Ruegeria sp. TaxID=1879320 RepID=UPI003B00FF93
MVPSHHYKDTYSEEDFEQLCKFGDLAPTDMDKFRRDLEEFAVLYRWENNRFQNLSPYKVISADLVRVRSLAARLANSLEQMGWDAHFALEKGIHADEARMITKRKVAPEHQSLCVSLAGLTEDLKGITIDIPTLKAILGGLEIAAKNGQANLSKRASKKIPDYGLRLWLINIVNRH